MDSESIREKFGDDYIASDNIYTMGIDHRFTAKIAGRFKHRIVLETCTGGGFTTIALAREARHVVTVEIDPDHQSQARKNIEKAGFIDKVTFILGDILDRDILDTGYSFDSAFLDPDWAISGHDHAFRFKPSNTRPPSDILLERVFEITHNVAIILPPLIDLEELSGLPEHELQSMYMGDSHELYCAYFGDLADRTGKTEYRV